MTKVSSIVNDALKTAGICGVGQPPLAEDSNTGFRQLNFLIAQWRRKKTLVYREADLSFTGTGVLSYTIGPTGADITAARPSRILAAFRRQIAPGGAQQVDSTLTILQAREDYNRVALKNLATVPSYLFYDPVFPNGVLYPWPLPNSQWEIHISVMQELAAFTSLAQDISLPPEYEAAMFWNLTKVLRTVYRRAIDPSINIEAKASLLTIRQANAQIATLTMPPGLPVGSRNTFNVYSGQ